MCFIKTMSQRTFWEMTPAVENQIWLWFEWNALRLLHHKKNSTKLHNLKQNQYNLQSLWCMQWQSDSCRHLQSTGLDHLKCCSRRCIQFDGHSSLGWWMNRRVEEDMVNVAPNPCVPFYFLSPAKAEPDPGQSLQLKPKVTEAMNRPLWFLCVSFMLSASSGHRNLVLLLLFFLPVSLVWDCGCCALRQNFACTEPFWLGASDC